VRFSAETVCGGSITWDFGDGNGTSQSVANGSVTVGLITYYWWNYTHTYRYIGMFVATFSISSGPYNVHVSVNVHVSTVGSVSFHATPNYGSPSLRVGFSYETFYGSGGTAKWTYGDGNTSTQSSPNGTRVAGSITYQWWNYTHTYTYTRTFLAQVNVTAAKFYAPSSLNIYVSWVQGISFAESPNYAAKAPLRAGFSYETAFGVGYSATWTFGDGNVSTQTSPNGSAGGSTASYQWWNYTHTYHYVGSFIPQVSVSKATHHVSATTNVYVSFVPSLYYSFYNETGLLSRGISGSTYSIGLVETCSVDPSQLIPVFSGDLKKFDQQFGLPDTSLNFEGPGESSCPNPTTSWTEETDLDIPWAHVAAPGATIYVCLDNLGVSIQSGFESCVQTFYQYRLNNSNAWNTMIVANTWAYCAAGSQYLYQQPDCVNGPESASYSRNWSMDQLAGMNLISSSGDVWPGFCVTAYYPASNPYGLAVGGTTVTSVGTAGSYGSEKQWNDTWQAGGSQTCSGKNGQSHPEFPGETWGSNLWYQAPNWQLLNLSSHRSFPDVSMIGNRTTGVPVVVNGGWFIEAGTSLGAPIWAGVLDVLFQAQARGLSGFAGQFLYNHTSCFHVIALLAGGGRDGLGTPDVGCLSKV
jgi:subtilase family serine protease